MYHEWIDECERIQEETGSAAHSDVGPLPRRAPYVRGEERERERGRVGGRVGDGSGAPSSYTGSHDYLPPSAVLERGKRVDDSDEDDFLDEPGVLLSKKSRGEGESEREREREREREAAGGTETAEVDAATSFLDSLV